jgi:hypothetical protein
MAFTYELVLEDGTLADPRTFVSSEPNWREGDRVLIRPGFEFEIVAINESAGDANGTWTVAPLGGIGKTA